MTFPRDTSLGLTVIMQTSNDADDQLIEEEIEVGELYIYRAGNGELAQITVMGAYQITTLTSGDLIAGADQDTQPVATP